MKNQTETRHTDPETGGQKGAKPCRMDLVPAPFMWEMGEVYGMGSKKYSDHNWAKGYKWSYSIAALLRHLYLWLRGEKLDKESGFHHLAHVAWHCATLYTFEENNLGTDDRLGAQLDLTMPPPPGKDLLGKYQCGNCSCWARWTSTRWTKKVSVLANCSACNHMVASHWLVRGTT